MRLLNRREYLNKLRILLQNIPKDELEDILSDYEEHFHIGISKGKTEEEISKELGDPYDIANNYISSNKNASHAKDTGGNLLLILLLGFFNLVIVLTPYLTIVGLLLGLYGTGLGILFGGVLILLGIPFNIIIPIIQPHILTSIGFGIGLTTLGLLGLILALFLTKLLIELTVKYIKWNMDIIRKGGF